MNLSGKWHAGTLERRSVTRTNIGSEVVSWVKVSGFKFKAKQVRGNESIQYKQLHAETVMRFTCRYRADIGSEMRIVWNGLYYDIFDINNIDGRNRELEIMAKQGLSNG